MKQFTIFNQLTAMPKRLAMVLTVLFTLGVGSMWGAEEVYKTAKFGSSYNSGNQSSYSNSWYSTNNGFRVDITNANNNNNGWAYIKMGSKNSASTGTITTNAAIDKAVTKVSLTIDAITTNNITSITLKTATSSSGIYTSVGTFAKSKGTQTVTLSNPTANLFYKIEVVCTKGSSNGLIQISQVDYYAESSPASKTLSSIAVSGQKTEYIVGDEFVKPTVTATYSDASTADVTSSATCSGYDMSTTGSQTVTVSYTEGSVTKTTTYSITVSAAQGGGGGSSDGDCVWEKVAIGDIESTDVVAITMTTNNGTIYALSSANGTSSAPAAVVVTAKGNQLDEEVAENLQWNISNNSGNLTIYPNGTTSTWLYCTGTNNGVRVGTNTNKTFTIDASSGYLKHTSTSRYVGVYTTTPDWRCYTNTTGNTANQTLAIYKKVCESNTPTPTQLPAPTGLNATNITHNSATLSWNTVTNASSYVVTVVDGADFKQDYPANTNSLTIADLSPSTDYLWTVTAIGDGTNYTNSEESETGEFTTTAAPVTTYTVTYNLNGGTGTTPTEGAKAAGAQFNLAASTGFSNTGYRFMGWNDGTTTYAAGAQYTMPAENVTFTAQWAQEFTVTYDANGGTSTCTDNNKYIQGETVTVCSNIPTKSDVTFAGWSDGTKTYLQSATFIMPAKNVTLTAQWKTIPKLDTPTNLGEENDKCIEKISLKWTKVANAQGYSINLDENGGESRTITINGGNSESVYVQGGIKPGTNYTWKIKAEGDDVNYSDSEYSSEKTFTTNYKITYDVKEGSWTACADGCVAGGEDFTICSTEPTKDGYNFVGWSTADDTEAEYQAGGTINNVSANTTLYAVWEQKTYTVILSENGTTTTPTTQTSTLYTLPTQLSVGSCQDDTKEWVGWSTVAIPNPGDKPTSKFYELGATVTLTEDQTTFYAVFATPEGAGTENVEATLSFASTAQRDSQTSDKQVWSNEGITFTNNKGSSTTAVADYSNPVRLYKNSDITIEAPGNITQIEFNCVSEYVISVTGATTSGTTVTVTLDGTSDTYTIKTLSAQVRLNSLVVTYTTQGGTSYSDYTTSCVALPAPVISFVTPPADPIEFDPVNCGSNSTKAQAKTVQVSGVNLQEYVSVEVTGPYKIARTSSTNLSDYTTSLTLDKTNTGNINANYSTIYIISCPPAQSTDATTGTLTFTTKKGNTLTVNLSTPTVNCTTYALTLNDRGTRTTAEYYAGASVPEPEDPTGVCTDPIHYVFDGWSLDPVTDENTTSYEKVTFPFEMPADKKTLYAVYRWSEAGGGDGDYHLVEKALDDWSGDYLIAYSNTIFADGRIGGKDEGIGALGVQVDLSSDILGKAIPASVGDEYNVTLEAITGGYLMKTKDGQYNYQSSNASGLSSTENKNVASKYPIVVDFVSSSDVKLCITNAETGSLVGPVFHYNTTSSGYFRFYKDGGQKAVYLYKKSSGTNYFTTSPACGPMLEITSGKEIYVTGGNAQAARDLVMAQQKVSYKATRLEKDKSTGNLPSIKVLPSNISYDADKTKAVTITFDEDSVRTLQSDGTYTISGTMTISYQPKANNVTDDIRVVLNANHNPSADVSNASFTVHARSLPQKFVIVAKSGDKWYALNADMSSSKAQPANGQVTLNDLNNPTEAIYAPCNAIYTFEAMPQGAEDRKSVRFIGMENKYLWAASEGNNGVQNYSKAPAADALAYNWKLYTEDNITYHFGNAQNTRMLGLHSTNVAFGMYANGASVVQDIRILPYVEKCLYNYAPTNLKVSVLKGTYVTLTWDAVAGATKYQYSTDGNTWTDAGTEPTVTINDLKEGKGYIYYIRAYHEDDATKECIDYSEITFTTADCDDVPADITYSADLTSITVTWTAVSTNCTVRLYSDEACTSVVKFADELKGSVTFSQLDRNTTYYVRVFAEGTCASPIIPVKTEDVEVDIVEWMPDGIIVDINTDETVGVTLENEVAFGTGVGKKAEDIFFSKYFEANGTAKILAIYNGTDEKIDLSTVSILNDLSSQSLDLAEFGHKEVGYIYPNEEIILFNKGVEAVTECSEQQDSYPDWYNVEHGVLNFGGRATLILKRDDAVIDIIGSIETKGINYPNDLVGTTIYNIAKSPTGENEKPSWGDDPGWVCESGDNIMTDVEETDYPLSTNRCLLVRKNTVVSGVNAVTNNINKVFATLCDEWVGLQIPQNAPSTDKGVTESCEGMAFVGDFDYSSYYTKYESMGDEKEFDKNDRNADGTVTIPITDLYKQSCRNIRIKLSNSNGDVLTDREYKVPIIITTTQGTDGQTFLDLQQNLATKEVDGDGNVIDTHPLSLEQVREICKTCDVVVRDNATLTKVTDGTTNDHPQVRNVYVYEGASIVIPDGDNHNYTINGLSLRRKGDVVASAQVQGTGKFVLPADEPVCLDLRVDANNWHWFTLPYDCDIADVTWVDGTPAKYNTDWFLMYYDGESRAASTNPYDNHWKVYNGTTIEAGKGYIVGITGDLTHPDYTFELRFPMAQGVLTAEQTDKTVPVNAWGVTSDNKPNNLGWNLVGNPYLNYYKTADEYSPLAGLPLIQYINTDPVTGEWNYKNSGSVPYVATPIDGGWYEYRQELASEVNMMPFTAYFVQVGDPNTHENGQELEASFEASNRGKKSIVRRAPREVEEIEEPIIVRVELTNSKGESDKTSLVIDQRFTNEYEMNGDFFKWFGDYYNYYTKPVLYTIGADQGKRAFNALNEELAAQPIPMGMYAAQAGNYTFSLNQQFDLSRVEEVWLYDATQSTYTNLMQSDYTFSTSKVNGAGRFSLSVKLAPKVATSIDNVTADKVWATTQNQQIIVNGLENNTQLWICDAAGKLVQMDNTQYYQHRYSVPQVGTYFIALQKGTTKQTIKVVVE